MNSTEERKNEPVVPLALQKTYEVCSKPMKNYLFLCPEKILTKVLKMFFVCKTTTFKLTRFCDYFCLISSGMHMCIMTAGPLRRKI